MGIKKDGTAWAWGQNSHWGQLGNGKVDWFTYPVPVRELAQVVAVAAGQWHTVFLCGDGSVWVCGANNKGQLGLGQCDLEVHPVPVRVEGL